MGIFTAIKVFNWVGTLYKGSIVLTAPFAYICGFIFFLVFGGMTGVAMATVSLDVHWQDTYFVVAHFHFIMVGAVLMGFLAAIHYWFPKMFGRQVSESWALLAAGLIILAFNATFIPQFLLGNAGMPRRYYEVPAAVPMLTWPRPPALRCSPSGSSSSPIYLAIALKYGEGRGPQPLGEPRLRVDRALAAPDRELRHGPRLHPGTPRVPVQQRSSPRWAMQTSETARKMTAEGWLEPPPLPHHYGTIENHQAALRFGMWLFLGTEVLLFAGIFVGYFVFRSYFPESFEQAARHLRASPWGPRIPSCS